MVPKENNIKIVITLYQPLYRDINTHFTYKNIGTLTIMATLTINKRKYFIHID